MLRKKELLRRIVNLEKAITGLTLSTVTKNTGSYESIMVNSGIHRRITLTVAIKLLAEHLEIEFEYPNSEPMVRKIKSLSDIGSCIASHLPFEKELKKHTKRKRR